MIFFFGIRKKTIVGKKVDGFDCPNCYNREFQTYGKLKYFHLYWVPIFMIKKTAIAECTNCKNNLREEEIPISSAKEIDSSVFTKWKIISKFIGLIIPGLLLALIIVGIIQTNLDEKKFIANPKINDVYIVNAAKIFDDVGPDREYAAMRIKNRSGTLIDLEISKYFYKTRHRTNRKIDEKIVRYKPIYANKPFQVSIDQLKDMLESGEIESIIRK